MVGGYGVWVDRLGVAHQATRRALEALAGDGPFAHCIRLAGWDTWRGAMASHFQELILGLDRREVLPFVDHLSRLAAALCRLADEASLADQMERTGFDSGLLYSGPDVPAALGPWRSWPPTPYDLLPPGWERPPSGGELFMDIGAVRLLARSLAEAAEDIETCRLRLKGGLECIDIEPPPFLRALVAAAQALSEEIRRRADAMEEADQQAATAIQEVANRFAGMAGPLAGMFQGWTVSGRTGHESDPVADHRVVADDPRAPLVERYEANRWLIRNEIDRLAAQRKKNLRRIDKEKNEPAGAPEVTTTTIAWLERENEAIAKKMQRFQGWADSGRQFLMFDPRGSGRAAEVHGDLDAAANLAVVVPGMSNDLSNFDHLSGNAKNLYQASAGYKDTRTATIAWLGYHTPHSLDVLVGTQAEAGGKTLANFVRDLASHGEKHLTIVGHSYGTCVIANAVSHHGLRADELVFVGSPGFGDDHVNLGDARLWYGDAKGDPVTFFGPDDKGAGPADLGATRFPTSRAHGHSEYFRPGTASVSNIGAITAGHPEAIAP